MSKSHHCSICQTLFNNEWLIHEGDNWYCDMCYVIKNQQQTNTDNSFIVPDIIRRSYIETYRSCPYKFYLEVIKGIQPKLNTIHAQIGIDLHELFAKACQDKNYTNVYMVKDFQYLWHSYDESRFADYVQKDLLLNRSLDCIREFYMKLQNFPSTPYAIEEKLTFDVGDNLPSISTTLDRVDLINDELDIADWKTGKTMVGEKLSTDLQAPLYIYGAKKKYNKLVRRFRFIYLQDGKERVFDKINDNEYCCTVRNRKYIIKLDGAIKEVQSVFSHIKKGDFNVPNNVRNMYFTCKMCHLQGTQCQGADLQSWRNVQ